MYFDQIGRCVGPTVRGTEHDLLFNALQQRRYEMSERGFLKRRLDIDWRHCSHLLERIAQILLGATVDVFEPKRRAVEDIDFVETGLQHMQQTQPFALSSPALGHVYGSSHEKRLTVLGVIALIEHQHVEC